MLQKRFWNAPIYYWKSGIFSGKQITKKKNHKQQKTNETNNKFLDIQIPIRISRNPSRTQILEERRSPERLCAEGEKQMQQTKHRSHSENSALENSQYQHIVHMKEGSLDKNSAQHDSVNTKVLATR